MNDIHYHIRLIKITSDFFSFGLNYDPGIFILAV